MKELCTTQREASILCVLLGLALTASTQQSWSRDLRNSEVWSDGTFMPGSLPRETSASEIRQEAVWMNDVSWFMTNRISVSLTSNETAKASLITAVTQDKHLVNLKLLTFEETVCENQCGYAQGCVAPSKLCCLKRRCTRFKEQKMFHSLWVVGGIAVQFPRKRTAVLGKLHGKGYWPAVWAAWTRFCNSQDQTSGSL